MDFLPTLKNWDMRILNAQDAGSLEKSDHRHDAVMYHRGNGPHLVCPVRDLPHSRNLN